MSCKTKIFCIILFGLVCSAVLAVALNMGFEDKGEKEQIVVKSSMLYSNPVVCARVEKKYPHIKFENEEILEIPSGAQYAAIVSGQQSFVSMLSFMENEKLVKIGCAADITREMESFGYTEAISPEYLESVTVNGRIYGIPRWTYHMGMVYNRDIFEEAGLVDSEGNIIYPKTYEELAQTAHTIREKTGKYGFFWPNTQGQGGWSFMNIAWSYGVEFMKEENGRIVASFDTPECVSALQYIKDLKWKHNVLPDEIFGDQFDFVNMFEQGKVAMGFIASSEIDKYSGNLENKFEKVAFSRMPAGPSGRFSLRGGTLLVFAPWAKSEQIEAVMYWLEESGFTPDTDEEARKLYEEECKRRSRNGEYVGYTDDSVFKSREYKNMRDEISKRYINFDYKLIEDFADDTDMTYKMEYKHYQQELYRILDVVIQTVMTDENADCTKLIAEANEKFQTAYLDKIVY